MPDPPASLQGKNAVSASSVDNVLVESPIVESSSAEAPGGLQTLPDLEVIPRSF